MRHALLAGLAVLALGVPRAAEAQDPRVTIRMRPFTRPIVLDTLVRTRDHSAAAPAAFRAVLDAFETSGIPATTVDSAAGVAANLRFIQTGTAAGVQLSQLVNCGTGMLGPNADHHRVTLAIAGFVDPRPGGGSRVGFALTGSSIDMSGNSVDPDACESAGILEARLHKLVEARLAAGTG